VRSIQFLNTLTGQKELFKPRIPGRISFYSCGPTVYGWIHIGNLRGGLVADLIYRHLKRLGFEVTYVRNYTDVDDKIIQRAKEEGLSAEALAQKYILEVEKDYAVAGMLEPTHKTTVTTHMPEIISMIESLITHEKAYVIEGGEVLYSIDAFPEYGKLSHKKLDELIAGIRVEVNVKKKNPLDFTLWKPAKPGEPAWNSPWGLGRPGWHIECSAMATKWLGPQMDLHHGGEDLVFPHHENEIAQTEGATGCSPFVGVWLHHAFLTLSKEKMSKSLGNIFTAREFLTRFSGEVARYMLLSVHYRSMIDFGPETLEQALNGLHRIYEAKEKALHLCGTHRARSDLRAEGMWGEFLANCEKTKVEIADQFANDLNTPGVLAALFSLIRDYNRICAEPLAMATPAAVLGSQELIRIMESDVGEVLGVGRALPESMLHDLNRIRLSCREAEGSGAPQLTEVEILTAIEARAQARKMKDFARADAIRKDLESRGVMIQDRVGGGTQWEYR
jgi:cysteinyl-tRNA synthetase